jgi:cyclopropane fatty-acyl-phospholipid synthase-like methyltransferase
MNNSTNKRFNHKLYKLLGSQGSISILDLGCSGGGFIRDVINDGHLGVGLEGSDYSKKRRRAEWATIPDFLFTCDVTGEFRITYRGDPLKFHAVTSWELIEHIAEKDLPALSDNVRRHLAPGGVWIMSISPNSEIIDGTRLHQTVQPENWWTETFSALGWRNSRKHVEYFRTQFVRGPKYGAPGSFHLVLTDNGSEAPPAPALSAKEKIFDSWYNSGAHRLLKLVLLGPE